MASLIARVARDDAAAAPHGAALEQRTGARCCVRRLSWLPLARRFGFQLGVPEQQDFTVWRLRYTFAAFPLLEYYTLLW